MEPTPDQQRQEAHVLLDGLPDSKIAAVRNLLEVMLESPQYTMESAPYDDEQLNDETIAAIERAEASLANGEGTPHDEVMREFGLKR